ncbi:hypothetical protein DPMN_064448 [Dreissena polymorpha]|uniref:Uncharacterized protein n=1 Tax=Dreissena polymorpha TaxID=45954 RepID=A0A9D4HL25_DREPO|nr:hypothetical protein DPMN_064448 [Dreissena polymorpha]
MCGGSVISIGRTHVSVSEVSQVGVSDWLHIFYHPATMMTNRGSRRLQFSIVEYEFQLGWGECHGTKLKLNWLKDV